MPLPPNESELKKSHDLLAAITQIQAEFIEDAGLHSSFNHLLEILLRITESQYGFIGEVLYNAENQPYLKTYSTTNIAWSPESEVLYPVTNNRTKKVKNLKTLFGDVISSGEMVIANTPVIDTHKDGLLPGHPPLNAFLGLPLYHRSKMIGMIGLANRVQGYDQKLVDYLHPLLVACASMIASYRAEQHRKTAEAARENYAQRLQLLRQIDGAILAAESTEDITRAAVSYIRQLVPCDRATLVLYHLDREIVELMAVNGIGQERFPEKTILPLANYPPLEPLLRGEARYLRDLMQQLDLAPVVRRLAEMGLRSFVSLPLRPEGRLIGALTLSSKHPNGFTEEGIDIIREVANQIAIALRQSQLRKQISQHTEELEARVAERTAELTIANERLRELDDLKSKFVSDVSHELRTPIAGLNIRLHLLERSQPDDIPRHIGLLKDQLAGLNKLIESILDLSRMDLTDADKLTFAPIDLNTVIEAVSSAYEPLAAAAGLGFSFTPSADLPLIRGEYNQLSQVVTNLVANAINYTPSGHIYVKTWATAEHVYLAVEDTGMGIDAQEMPHIFTRFYRGERVGQSKMRGTGLGLGIVKEIIDLHSGAIEVKSVRDQGSVFTVMFPIWRPA